jgi:hypothetical protein
MGGFLMGLGVGIKTHGVLLVSHIRNPRVTTESSDYNKEKYSGSTPKKGDAAFIKHD